MKISLVILFMAISNYGLCQEFNFNLVTNYRANQDGILRNKVVYSNIDDQKFFLFLKKDSEGNTAYLTDLKNSKIHQLALIEKTTNGETSLEFSYIESKPLKQISLTKNYNYKFETVEEDSIYKTVRMTCFKNKKKPNNSDNLVSLIKIKKYPKNLFPLFRFSYLHLYEYRTDIDLNENGIVESSKFIGNRKLECHLSYFEEVNFKIIIPN